MRYWPHVEKWKTPLRFTLWILLLLPVFGGAPNVLAQEQLMVSEYTYKYGDRETLEEAKKICLEMAMKRAVESAMVDVKAEIRVNADGVATLDMYTVARGTLRNIKILEEKVDGDRQTVYCRIQGAVEISDLEDKLKRIIEDYRIKPNRMVTIAFHSASIDAGMNFSRDDTKPAPDAYVIVKDKYGNDVFSTANDFINNRKYGQLIKNRNNYNPQFLGSSFKYTFSDDDYLMIQLVDWDGLEGFMGRKNSQDDMIGSPFYLTIGHQMGTKTIGSKGWKLVMEIQEFK